MDGYLISNKIKLAMVWLLNNNQNIFEHHTRETLHGNGFKNFLKKRLTISQFCIVSFVNEGLKAQSFSHVELLQSIIRDILFFFT